MKNTKIETIKNIVADVATIFTISYGASKMAGDVYNALSKNTKTDKGKTALQIVVGLIAGFSMSAMNNRAIRNSQLAGSWEHEHDIEREWNLDDEIQKLDLEEMEEK